MKKGPLILIGVGVLIALATSIGSFRWLKAQAESRVIRQETVEVAIASADIPWGTVLSRQMIKFMPYLKASLPGGYHTSAATLEGRVTIYPLKENAPIFESSLAPKDIKTGGMAAVVSPKKRAMAVRVDKVIGVSGFIFPGNRVDVLVTLTEQKEGQAAVTKTVLQNILVLASGPEVDKTGKQEKPSTVDVITLEVTPEEGEKLALAATEGKVQLALRNFADKTEATTRGVTFPTLLGSYRPGPDTKPIVSARKTDVPVQRSQSQPRPYATVEVIQGSKMTSVKFDKGE